jgi:hypothetical protein
MSKRIRHEDSSLQSCFDNYSDWRFFLHKRFESSLVDRLFWGHGLSGNTLMMRPSAGVEAVQVSFVVIGRIDKAEDEFHLLPDGEWSKESAQSIHIEDLNLSALLRRPEIDDNVHGMDLSATFDAALSNIRGICERRYPSLEQVRGPAIINWNDGDAIRFRHKLFLRGNIF